MASRLQRAKLAVARARQPLSDSESEEEENGEVQMQHKTGERERGLPSLSADYDMGYARGSSRSMSRSPMKFLPQASPPLYTTSAEQRNSPSRNSPLSALSDYSEVSAKATRALVSTAEASARLNTLEAGSPTVWQDTLDARFDSMLRAAEANTSAQMTRLVANLNAALSSADARTDAKLQMLGSGGGENVDFLLQRIEHIEQEQLQGRNLVSSLRNSLAETVRDIEAVATDLGKLKESQEKLANAIRQHGVILSDTTELPHMVSTLLSKVQALQEHVFSLERDLHVGRPPRSPAAGHLMSDQALQTPPRLPQSRLDSLESVKKAEREASHQRAAASALAAANASLDCLQARLHLGSDGGATSGSLDQSEPGASAKLNETRMVSLATFMDQAVQDQAVQGPRSVLNTSQVAPADDPVDFRVEADSGSFVIIALQCAATLCMVVPYALTSIAVIAQLFILFGGLCGWGRAVRHDSGHLDTSSTLVKQFVAYSRELHTANPWLPPT